MTKKRFVAILLCVTLVALAAIGATFAYLTDSKTVKNTFTVGDVKIKLDETNVNAPEGDRVTSNTYWSRRTLSFTIPARTAPMFVLLLPLKMV